MIEGEKDPEAGEVDKEERTPWLKKKELIKGKVGDNKSWDYSEKKRAGEETDVALTNGREG